MELTVEDVINNRELLEKVIKAYNGQKKAAAEYYEKNKEKRIQKSLSYYYKKEGKEPKTENKTADIKKYMKEYRQKQKEKKNNKTI
jgi:hypothetical protein